MGLEYLDGSLEGVAVVGFNRPKARNAVSRQMLAEINDAVNLLKFDKNLRVVIFRSVILVYNSTPCGVVVVGVVRVQIKNGNF